MFKEMRRQDKRMDNSSAIAVLESGQYGVLSMVGDNGYGYGVPLSYVYFKNSIYFHCALEGSKLDNIKQNNKVSFCVVGSEETLSQSFSVRYESVIVFGQAAEVLDDEKQAALEAIITKYSKDYMESGLNYIMKDSGITRVYKVSIEHMTGKAGR